MTRLLWLLATLFPLFVHAAEPLPAEEVFKPNPFISWMTATATSRKSPSTSPQAITSMPIKPPWQGQQAWKNAHPQKPRTIPIWGR